MKTLQGTLVADGLRVGIVASRFNEFITAKLLSGAMDGLLRHGVREEDIQLAWVPGAFEIPLIAQRMARSGRYDAVICLGAVIRGPPATMTMCATRCPRASPPSPWRRGCRCCLGCSPLRIWSRPSSGRAPRAATRAMTVPSAPWKCAISSGRWRGKLFPSGRDRRGRVGGFPFCRGGLFGISGVVVAGMELLQVADLLAAAVQLGEHRLQGDALLDHQHRQVVDEVADLPHRFLLDAVLGSDDGLGALLPTFFRILSSPWSKR